MAGNISMMNPKLGISGVTTPWTEEFSISGQRRGVSPALSVSGNEKGFSTYDGRNLDTIVDQYLTPKSGNPDLMSPHIFQQTLAGALDKLAGSDGALSGLTADIRENNDILRMFSTLVVPG